jgi:hypothetical protein
MDELSTLEAEEGGLCIGGQQDPISKKSRLHWIKWIDEKLDGHQWLTPAQLLRRQRLGRLWFETSLGK